SEPAERLATVSKCQPSVWRTIVRRPAPTPIRLHGLDKLYGVVADMDPGPDLERRRPATIRTGAMTTKRVLFTLSAWPWRAAAFCPRRHFRKPEVPKPKRKFVGGWHVEARKIKIESAHDPPARARI